MATRFSILCDGCHLANMHHFRYKCLRCGNYDLCRDCHEKKVETLQHSKNHPFQCLLDRAARQLFFGGEPIPLMSAESFTCPFCGKMGHSFNELINHVQLYHYGDSSPVICPLCAALPSANTVRMRNLADHVATVHVTSIYQLDVDTHVTQMPRAKVSTAEAPLANEETDSDLD